MMDEDSGHNVEANSTSESKEATRRCYSYFREQDGLNGTGWCR
jgi:hypothetical protein